MKKGLNYNHLYVKYLGGADCVTVVHDRTWEGLEVVKGPPKPSMAVFDSFQAEEDRQARAAGVEHGQRLGLMEEKQAQARAKAMDDIVPFEHKLQEAFQNEREKAFQLKKEALEVQYALKEREHVMDGWLELTRAQDLINEEARKYLAETDWYVTRKNENGLEIPEEVMQKRAEARARIQAGELVYADWDRLRKNEMPSRAELQEALLKGGEHLAKMREVCKAVVLRYPKPRVR